MRRKTRAVAVGDLIIGGESPVSVQSMTSTKTENVESTVDQIERLQDAGCELIRVAVPTPEAAKAISKIRRRIRIPLVADIHFNHRLAIQALEGGADKIRINPGNIGSRSDVQRVLRVAKERSIPVRIGVNAGSLKKEMIERYNGVCAEALFESAKDHIRLCEDVGFDSLVISIKASDVVLMIEANRTLAGWCDYPIHLGVTEAGSIRSGVLRSAVGIGTLLAEGIGDTIRVSLTGDPIEEVAAAYRILKTLKLRSHGLTLISCPTCGRLEINIVPIVEKIEKELADFPIPLTVAVMGCAVNGPGEAREADIGVACGKKEALLFKKGCVVGKLKESEIVKTIVNEVLSWES